MNLKNLFGHEDRPAIEKWCRAHVQQAYLGDHMALCRVLGKFLMYVDTRDQSLAPHLMMNGYWEMWVTQAVVNYVKPGMRCIDVGANFGYYSLLLAELVGDGGEVTAYEPQRALAELLRSSASVNGLRVVTKENAVGVSSNLPFSKTLHVDPARLGSTSFRRFDGATEVFGAVVASLSGDHPVYPVDFVKIDVQGAELEVLAGMKHLIERSPNIAIAMEFTPSEHEDPAAAIRSLHEDYGLQVRAIGTDGLIRQISTDAAIVPDTGDHRMLWLTRAL